MSATVRISLKAAKALLDNGPKLRALAEVSETVEKHERSTSRRATASRPSEAARATKREETAAIRSACVIRSGGKCEVCGTIGGHHRLELDHFFGRGKVPQSTRNCWMLCELCHHQKTNNKPTAAVWLTHFIAHAEKYGYAKEAATAKSRLAFVLARGGQ